MAGARDALDRRGVVDQPVALRRAEQRRLAEEAVREPPLLGGGGGALPPPPAAAAAATAADTGAAAVGWTGTAECRRPLLRRHAASQQQQQQQHGATHLNLSQGRTAPRGHMSRTVAQTTAVRLRFILSRTPVIAAVRGAPAHEQSTSRGVSLWPASSWIGTRPRTYSSGGQLSSYSRSCVVVPRHYTTYTCSTGPVEHVDSSTRVINRSYASVTTLARLSKKP